VRVPAIIVGGGVAGLAAAYELHRRGVSFLLLEKATRAGGVVLSEQIGGFTIDAGPDALLVQKPDGVKLCEELGLGDRLIATKPPRLAYIQRGGVLHPLPSSSVLGVPTRIAPFLKTGLFTWAGKMRMGAEIFVPPRRDEADESIGAFMTRRFGLEATTYLAEPLLAGIHAGDVDRLSTRALFPRFVESERKYGSLIRAFRKQATAHVSADGPFRSLPGGLSELTNALVRALPSESIRLGQEVGRVVPARPGPGGSGDPAVVRVETTAGERFETRAIILATPAYVTGRIMRESSAELTRLCGEIPYASTATIALAFLRASVQHPLNGSGFVVPRAEGSGILAASWLSSKWSHRAPDDHVLMRTFVGGARDPEAFDRSDDELVHASIAALRPLLGISGEPLLKRVYRWERASAQHEVGHLGRLEQIERLLAASPGIFVTGSAFRGVGIPDCVADGRATARKVTEYLDSISPGPS
jgi:oxygen-dependent protoporphyrinogen oxidase